VLGEGADALATPKFPKNYLHMKDVYKNELVEVAGGSFVQIRN